jgi:hypothetical protein
MLNLLNNLIKVSGVQGGTIHNFIDLNSRENLDYFFQMNKIIAARGYLTKEKLLQYASMIHATVNL